ncbi:MAG: hypothetical protein J7L77_10265 [Clostridiales bacterium]|nr:hypothetical protein [Clostridiales bacterium]
MAILGIDIGTTGCKCVAFTEKMEVISKAYREYPLIHGENGYVEQNSSLWWSAVVKTVREASYGLKSITSIGISSQGITFVPVDENGEALCNAFSWLDMRARKECDMLESNIGTKKLFNITGKKNSPAYTLPKLMWIKNNLPDIYKRTYKFLTAHDYIIYRLCGAFVTEQSLAAGTMAFDISSRTWDNEILLSSGIDSKKLPEVTVSGTRVGELSEKASLEIGLKAGIVISTGGQDQKCAACGAGLSFDDITVSLGTSSAITALYNKPVFTDNMSLPCFPYVDGENWVLEGFSSTAGASIKWFRDNISNGRDYKEIDSLIEDEYGQAPEGRLMFFPYLGGTATPEWYDADSGGFLGITLDTTNTHMATAILESIAFNIRANVEKMESLGKSYKRLSVFGGGANSNIWIRIIADVTGKIVKAPKLEETACKGAAIKAAGIDRFGIKDITGDSKIIVPDKNMHDRYNKKYIKYKLIEKKVYGG